MAISSLGSGNRTCLLGTAFRGQLRDDGPDGRACGSRLLVSCFYNGSLMLSLDERTPAARVLWKGKSDSEVETDGLHASSPRRSSTATTSTGCAATASFAVARDDRRACVETQVVTGEKARWASGQIVRQGNRYFINNDRGDLIIARLSPKGYEDSVEQDCSSRRRIPATVGTGGREQVAPGLREPAHLRPQRRRDSVCIAWPALRPAPPNRPPPPQDFRPPPSKSRRIL